MHFANCKKPDPKVTYCMTLYDMLKKAKQYKRKTDQWLPGMGDEERFWLQRGSTGKFGVMELFFMVIWCSIQDYIFAKTHRTITQANFITYGFFKKQSTRIILEGI